MGVDITTYLMYGIKLDQKKFDEETNERLLTIEKEHAIQNTE